MQRLIDALPDSSTFSDIFQREGAAETDRLSAKRAAETTA